MTSEEEPNFKPIINANITTLIVMVFTFITHSTQFYFAGDWSLSEFVAIRITIIVWGFVVPIVLFILAAIGEGVYRQNRYITLSLGIITVALSGVLLGLATYWTVADIINLMANLSYGVIVAICYVVMVVCLAVAIWMQIKSLLAGINLIKYYQHNKGL